MRIYIRAQPECGAHVPYPIGRLEKVVALLLLRGAVDIYGPKEAANFAFPETGNIDVTIKRFGQVDCGDVVLVREAHQYRQVCICGSERELRS